ncbi:MAG: hypothetical protein MRZ66_02725 [Clostridiales bacterium]|nr:hypothetical protein [Clostridiales bacterium]
MPIPFILLGIAAGTAAIGVGKSIKAGVDQKEANETNEYAQEIIDESKKSAKLSRRRSNQAITDLGNKKISVLNNSMTPFVNAFEKLHSIELIDSQGLDELKSFKTDKKFFDELKEMNAMASSIASGAAGGAVLGAITAFGAYGTAMTFGACATTGTLISSLSGAALTNATLAFLGGGALSVGGLGVAGGSAVLGGLVAGPALAVMGFVVGAKASANKDAAYSNLSKAREFKEEAKTVIVMCKGIRMRANMFERLLIKLNAIFMPLVYDLEKLIESAGTNYSKYTDAQKKTVCTCLSVASAIKAILDTPILTEDGSLTKESEQISEFVQNVIDNNGI